MDVYILRMHMFTYTVEQHRSLVLHKLVMTLHYYILFIFIVRLVCMCLFSQFTTQM